MFNSAAVDVTATPPICKAVEAFMVGAVSVPVKVGLASKAIVPVASGNVIVLSAVGLVNVIVVSLSSALNLLQQQS